jgi:hypothetical protein
VGALPQQEEQGMGQNGDRGGREEGSMKNQAGRVKTVKTLEGGREGSERRDSSVTSDTHPLHAVPGINIYDYLYDGAEKLRLVIQSFDFSSWIRIE